jgi:hypothetical protein
MRRALRQFGGLTAAAVLLVATDAHAGSEAERLFQLGRRASEMGKWATACSLFRESQRLEPAVGTLLNLGDCEEQQNHVAAALDYYQDALSRLSITDDRKGPLGLRIEAIEHRSGKLDLKLGDGAPPDSQVLVDGEKVPAEKRKKPLLLPAGGHLVIVTAVGYRGSRQQLEVVPMQTKVAQVWPGPPLEATELALATDERPAEIDREGRKRNLRIVGYTAIGLGVASAWVGSVTGILAIDRESVRKDNCSADNVCNQTGVDAARSGQTLATVSTITLAAGVVAAAGGLGLVITQRAAPASERKEGDTARNPLARTSIAAVPLPSGAAFSFARSF